MRPGWGVLVAIAANVCVAAFSLSGSAYLWAKASEPVVQPQAVPALPPVVTEVGVPFSARGSGDGEAECRRPSGGEAARGRTGSPGGSPHGGGRHADRPPHGRPGDLNGDRREHVYCAELRADDAATGQANGAETQAAAKAQARKAQAPAGKEAAASEASTAAACAASTPAHASATAAAPSAGAAGRRG